MPIELPLKIHLRFVPDQLRAIYQTEGNQKKITFDKDQFLTTITLQLLFGITAILFLLVVFYPVCLPIGIFTLILGMCVYIFYYMAKRKFLAQQKSQQKNVEDWISQMSKVKSFTLEVDDLQLTLYQDIVPSIFPWSVFQEYLLSEPFILLTDNHLEMSLHSLILPEGAMTAEEYKLLSEIIEQKMKNKTRLVLTH
ncbi:hypothetical protein QNI19_14930 [Cytophagaceae bacterium DM2B3-1]|uniref:YcxB-like protein domain-containing protein n=1 Tax=Xanthocytophaga flava TaxID=3048013 RepID=A0ABT7CKJ1_9BACT|nr:hypothetical protein [Xanthocytophaga flavus]MDJ1494236.1 hypothetical protein [Xanthocytophaga flavus]